MNKITAHFISIYFALIKETKIKKKKKNIYADKYDSFQAPLFISFSKTKYFNIYMYSDYYMIMVQKLHSVRLLVLYDSMHIRFHMACFAIQTHSESTQSLILISFEGELWV